MNILRLSLMASCLVVAAALPASARAPGPGTVFTCVSGTVTKASLVIVTNGPPKGSGFVETAAVGTDAKQFCQMILMSAQITGDLKAESESPTVIVVYGADVRLNQVPDGLKIKMDKF